MIGKTDHTGTIIKAWPDATMFTALDFDYKVILARLRQQAYLTKGIMLTLIDERSGERGRFYFEGGVKSYITHLINGFDAIGDVFYVEKMVDNVSVEIALQYKKDDYNEKILTFVNNVVTPQ